jgi:hypothetical protein
VKHLRAEAPAAKIHGPSEEMQALKSRFVEELSTCRRIIAQFSEMEASWFPRPADSHARLITAQQQVASIQMKSVNEWEIPSVSVEGSGSRFQALRLEGVTNIAKAREIESTIHDQIASCLAVERDGAYYVVFSSKRASKTAESRKGDLFRILKSTKLPTLFNVDFCSLKNF